ncbi:hypothetical protein OUZ56_017152 [Daphnia magna]|uniref:Peptidase A2 domain-containing protein n=1 Tax=Daphnia magna TaxID=35525 RepID=A0ABR0ASB6_9CRUS|nr:hypothetical protein OUZ56_017152 [Daphnia magna]
MLNFDGTNLIKEPVFCDEVNAAVIDTGAAVTVISPELLKKTQFVQQPWDGSGIFLANDSLTFTTHGEAEIMVTHKNRYVKGKAIVKAMSGIELLMGKDFLQQFGSIPINYQVEKPLLTMVSSKLEFQEAENTEESGEASETDAAIEKMDQKVEKLLDNLKSRIGKNLQEDHRSEVLKILNNFISCFAFSEDDLGHCTLMEHNTGVILQFSSFLIRGPRRNEP